MIDEVFYLYILINYYNKLPFSTQSKRTCSLGHFAMLLFTFYLIFVESLVAVSAEQAVPDYLRSKLAGLDSVPVGTWIVVSKKNFTLFVMDGDKIIESYGVSVGRNEGQKGKVGDNKTPEGMFRIIQIQNSDYWTHDFRDGKGEIKGAYGPWFIRLETGWKGIGIHGTHNPASIGTNATEGCIRLKNSDVEKLKSRYAKIGVPVLIF